jgi:hypothetical protein
MSTTNRYVKRSKITEARFRELVRYFALDLDAHKIAALTRLNRNTVNRYLLRIRERIAEFCDEASPVEGIGAGGNGDSSARGRIPVIGIFQRGGSIYTGFVLDGAATSCRESGRGRIEPDDILRPDAWRGYGGLAGEADGRFPEQGPGITGLRAAIKIPTAYGPSGAMPGGGSRSFAACPDRRFTCISKSASSGSIAATGVSTSWS